MTYQLPSPPDGDPRLIRIRVNGHGLLGVVLIVAAMAIGFVKAWQIPWLYFLLAIVGYASAVLVLTNVLGQKRVRLEDLRRRGGPDVPNEADRYFDLFRVLYGCHLAFMFLVAGLLFPVEDVRLSAVIFIVSVAGGMAIPFLLFLRKAEG